MSDDYVRKDLYDSNMAEIRSLIAESEKHYRMMSDAADARTQAQISEIRGEVKEIRAMTEATNKRIEDINRAINLRIDDITRSPKLGEKIVSAAFAITGIAIGLAAVIAAAMLLLFTRL